MVQRALEIYESIKSEADIKKFIDDNDPETLHLDFKSKPNPATSDLEDDIRHYLAKSLSGFANSDGGVVLVGVAEDKTTTRPRRFLEPVQDVKPFEQKVHEQLSRVTVSPVPGATAEAILVSSGSQAGYLKILVPRSDLAPHRTNLKDFKVYFRRAGESFAPMEHYEIADVFGRRHQPKLCVVGTLRYAPDSAPSGLPHRLWLELALKNEGRAIAKFPMLRVPGNRGIWQVQEGGLDGAGRFGLSRMRLFSNEGFMGGANEVIHAGFTHPVMYMVCALGPINSTGWKVPALEMDAEVAAEGMPLAIVHIEIDEVTLTNTVLKGAEESLMAGRVKQGPFQMQTFEWRPQS